MGGMETLEFVIHPDGRVEETVTGIIGRSCAEVTAKIEEQLGRVIQQQPTSEYFAEVGTIAQANASLNQQSYQQSESYQQSDWA
jgi:hypothetical protein